MATSLDRAASVALLLTSILLFVTIVRREFIGGKGTKVSFTAKAVEFPKYRTLAGSGVWVGDTTAPVVIIEFGDLECPFCARFHRSLEATLDSFGADVAHLFVHLPLPSHRFARIAAEASMCADEQGRFREMQSTLLENQQSFGLVPWNELAGMAGVEDLDVFEQCLDDGIEHPLIQRGIDLADSMKINITPTVMVNQWIYPVAPLDSLTGIVAAAIRRTK